MGAPEHYCTHADCRAHTAEELQFIAERLRRPGFIVTATRVAQTPTLVRCRHVPRKGPISAPLP